MLDGMHKRPQFSTRAKLLLRNKLTENGFQTVFLIDAPYRVIRQSSFNIFSSIKKTLNIR